MEETENQPKESVIRTSSERGKPLIVENSVFSSAYDFEVTETELDKSYLELNEKFDQREKCILELRNKLEVSGGKEFLYRTDDHYLLCYLRYRKFDIDRAFGTIRRAHSMRIRYQDMFAVPPNLDSLLDKSFATWLPYRDEEGRILLNVDFSRWNLEEMSRNEIIQYSNVILDLITMNPHCQINGTVGIWDFKGLTVKHLSLFANPVLLRNLSILLQDSNPNRIKLVILVNCNKLVRMFFRSIQFLLKKKIIDRIKMLGSEVTEIHQYINPVLLPKKYGGTLEESECSVTQHAMDNLTYLKYTRSFTTTSDGNS